MAKNHHDQTLTVGKPVRLCPGFLSGLALAVGFSRIFDFNLGVGAGLFTGAGTNPSGLGAVIDVVETDKIPMPDGLSVEQAVQFINVTYAIIYEGYSFTQKG